MIVRIKRYLFCKRETICIMCLFLFTGLFQALRCIEYPGLYFDAVNPDYLAVQFLYPQIQNPRWTVPYTGLPVLGQLYHGTLTVWLQSLVIGVMGSPSLVTLRITNMIYVIGISWSIYLICKQVRINKFIAIITIIAMMFSPQIYAIMRTQYYIKLPGTLLLLFSLYYMMKKEKNGYCLIISGILCGMAFYSYFIYIFFVPAMIVILLCQERKVCKHKSMDVLIWLTGFFNGSILYIIGYFDLFITSSDLPYNTKVKIVYLFAFAMICLCCCLCLYITKYYNDNKKLKALYLVLFFIIFVIGIAIAMNLKYIISVIAPHLKSLNVAGKKMDLGRRVKQFFWYWDNIMDNSCLEQMIFGISTSIFSKAYSMVFVSLSVIVGAGYKKYKYQNKIIKLIGAFWILLGSYFLCSLGFISRMGTQHFTPIFFITYIIIILEVGFLYSICKNNRTLKSFFSRMIVVILVIGIINSNLFVFNLKITGGNGYYSSQINQLAQNALSKKISGESEIYIFPEWGMLCGFNYLTSNQVLIMTYIDRVRINELLGQGYNVHLCAWNREMEAVYQKELEECGGGVYDAEVKYTFSNDGTEAFYILSLSGDQK